VLAVWFGCGKVPLMPGTAGSIGAIPLYLALRPAGLAAVAIAAVVVTAVGIWASGIVARIRKQKDPQVVCIDEVAGMLVTLLAAPVGWKGTLAGFVAFRVCDQLKPWPARAAERLPGGWGIVLDDVTAGVWAAAIVGVARRQGWL
jgi:phosphatidylglycerophosphatase A